MNLLNLQQYLVIKVNDNDSILYKFRADRARQISNALFNDNFKDFRRSKVSRFAKNKMVEYSEDLSKIVPRRFSEMPENTLSDVIADWV